MADTYTAVRTGVANYLIAQLSWATAANTFDYGPMDATVVFGALDPCALVVDFDPKTTVNWDDLEQGYLKGIPFIIEIYVEIDRPDATHGRDASETIATRLKQVEDVFESSPSIGGLAKGSTIRISKIEMIPLEAVKLAGIVARWAWVALTVYVLS